MNQKRIIIHQSRNHLYRDYAVNWCISVSPINNFSFPFQDRSYHKRDADSCGPVGRDLIISLSGIVGLTEAWLHPYELTVVRSKAIKWSEVESGIIAAIVESLPVDERMNVVVGYEEGLIPEDQDSLGLDGDLCSHQEHHTRD